MIEKVELGLNDGALVNLSNGAKMEFISSVTEFVDNAEDAGASKVVIEIDNDKRILTVLSVEDTDLEMSDWERLFFLGSGKVMSTKKSGVGKYSQGFKYAGANLIGEGNKGEVVVGVRPNSNKDWGAIQHIDYTNKKKYSDKNVDLCSIDEVDMPDGYNFMVRLVGINEVKDSDIVKLMIRLGIRYREKIENGETKILIRNYEKDGEVSELDILPQDRLYSKMGCRVDYHEPIPIEWNGDKEAVVWEWSDLGITRFEPNEYIDYDNPRIVTRGRKAETGVMSLDRSGVEIAINGVTIIYGEAETTFRNILGVSIQYYATGWRGRLNIKNLELADKYIKGGNKSNSSIDKSFSTNDDVEEIREKIKEAYDIVCRRESSVRDSYSGLSEVKGLNEWMRKEIGLNVCFKFGKLGRFETFTQHGDEIYVNLVSKFMSTFKGSKEAISIFLFSVIKNCDSLDSIESVVEKLEEFETDCKYHKIIKN